MGAEKLLKARKILLVEDDVDLRLVVQSILEGQGAEVRSAENGLVAKTILDLNQHVFDIILSDVKMPEMDGVTLLGHVKRICPHTPFLIFTGFAEALEAQQAFQLGAVGFLAKPFKMVELLKTIVQIINPSEKKSDQPIAASVVQDYCKVPVDDFLSATRLTSDVYVMVAEGRFIKVAHEGSEIEINRIQIYKEKKVDFFYVKTHDFGKYVGLNLKISRAALKTDALQPEKKLALFKHTAEILTQQIFVAGIDENLCKQAGVIIENTLKVIGESDDLLNLLLMMQSHGDRLYSHSVGVAIYSVMLAKKLGWTNSSNHYKLTLGSLFHDIGMKELPANLLDKSRVQMSQEEIRLYESHPVRSREILLEFPEFPGDLTQIVYQHHENQIGTGYPTGLSHVRIHPLAKVMRVADEVSEKLAAFPKACQADAAFILNRMLEIKSEEFDSETLGAAYEVFGLECPEQLKKKVAS